MKSFGTFVVVSTALIHSALANESIYTQLSGKACQLVRQDEVTGSTEELCPGVAGYKLGILSDDARVSINVISPNGKTFPLNYWEVISGSFTTLGEKAEWLVVREGQQFIPKALIVRVKAFEDVEHPKKFTSYLSVSKIGSEDACVTDKIGPGPQQNEQARRAAESASSKPCLK